MSTITERGEQMDQVAVYCVFFAQTTVQYQKNFLQVSDIESIQNTPMKNNFHP